MFQIFISIISFFSAILVNFKAEYTLTYSIINFITIFSLNFIILSLISLIFSFNRKTFEYYIIILNYISFLLFAIQIRLGHIMTPSVISSIIDFESNEISTISSLHNYILLIIIPLLPTVLVFKYRSKIIIKSKKNLFFQMTLMFFVTYLLTFAIKQNKIYKHTHNLLYQKKNKSIRIQSIKNIEYSSPINLIRSLLINFKLMISKNSNLEQIDISLNKEHENLKVYFIIGESARFDRFSINGYNKKTNPRLRKVKNLINFNQMNLSCGSSTKESIPCMLAEISKSKKYDLFKIFKKAQFNTTLYSPHGNHIFKPIIQSMSINADLYLNHYTNDFLILNIIKQTTKSNSNSFNVIQMIGSHSINVEKDNSQNIKFFQPYCKSASLRDCFNKEGQVKMNNSYDNTIILTDFIIAEIFDILKNENAILFYASDHGELLGEEGYFNHAVTKSNGDKPKKQYEIPLFIWMSNKYIENNQEKYKKILKRSKATTNHIELYKSIIACNDINVEGLDLKGHYCN